jgi:prepilin-type N-terminal cleavage/methylation domain-containing protein
MKAPHHDITQPLAGEDAGAPRQRAFTLLELAVVLAILALLAVTLLPVMAKSRPNTLAFQCRNNNRRLCSAWRMYADDNHDRLVYSSGVDAHSGLDPAWTLSHLDYDPNNTGNWDTNVDIVVRPLWPYTGKDASIYRCPADTSAVFVNGVLKPRVRSFVMNAYLGDGGGFTDSAYRSFFKTTDLAAPDPNKTFVFLELRWDLINWGNFITDMAGYSPNNPTAYAFYDLPAYLHDLGCSFSFGDGHTEIHRWLDARTTPPLSYLSQPTGPIPSPRNQDAAWLQDHTTRPK